MPKGGVEGHQAGDAHQEIQAGGEQRQITMSPGCEQKREPTTGRERRHEADRPPHARQGRHHGRHPSRPQGRMINAGHEGEAAKIEKLEEQIERQHLAVDERAEERAPEGAEAADDHHHEGLDDDPVSMPAWWRMGLISAPPRPPRTGRSRSPGVERVDVDAERAERLAVQRSRMKRPTRVRSTTTPPSDGQPSRRMNRL
jgi:hypothetical protein